MPVKHDLRCIYIQKCQMWALKTSDTEGKPLLNVPARSKVTSLTMFGSADSTVVRNPAALKASLILCCTLISAKKKKGRLGVWNGVY